LEHCAPLFASGGARRLISLQKQGNNNIVKGKMRGEKMRQIA
jgi:hypothetical protein